MAAEVVFVKLEPLHMLPLILYKASGKSKRIIGFHLTADFHLILLEQCSHMRRYERWEMTFLLFPLGTVCRWALLIEFLFMA